jgi:hypothetical protein
MKHDVPRVPDYIMTLVTCCVGFRLQRRLLFHFLCMRTVGVGECGSGSTVRWASSTCMRICVRCDFWPAFTIHLSIDDLFRYC